MMAKSISNRFQSSITGGRGKTDCFSFRSALPAAHVSKTARTPCCGLGDGASPVSKDRFLMDRPAGFFGNCARGGRWQGLGQGDALPGVASVGRVGPTDHRPGIRCHDERKRRQRVRLKFPSGLLMARPKPRPFKAKSKPSPKQNQNLIPLMPPGKECLAGPDRGKVTAGFHPLRRDGFP